MKLLDDNQNFKNLSGRRIRDAREGKVGNLPKLTQDQLAARLQAMDISIDRLSICRIERGNRQITDVELAAISQALSVSVEWLLFGKKEKLPELAPHASSVAEEER